MNRTSLWLAAAGLLLAAAALRADNVTGSDSLLCTASQATICSMDGECSTQPPWNLNIPHFIEVDLVAMTLGTTEASGQSRSTPIKNLERDGGLIVLQGFEDERAFSFVIAEEDGMLSVAVARDGVSVAAFGACTPMPTAD